MSYSLETVNNFTKKICFNFEELNLETQIKTSIDKKRKTVTIKGFRKGKAPLDMVEKIYGAEIETDALNSFIQKELQEAVSKENLHVISHPSLEDVDYKPGASISFKAVVEIFPSIELKDYKSLQFEREKTDVTKKEIEEHKENLLSQKSIVKEVEDESTKLEKGHSAVCNFQGVKEDGSRPDNMGGKEHLLEIGSNQFIPGFEEGMVGMKKGEKRNLDLSFPKEYHVEELKGAKVTFEVELLEIKKKETPKLTEELAKELGYESISDLEQKTKDQLTQTKKNSSDKKLQQDILEKLIEENSFDVPSVMVEREKESLEKEMENNLISQGLPPDMVKGYLSKQKIDFSEKALFKVRSGLILEKLSEKYNIQVVDEDIENKVEEIVSQNTSMNSDELRKAYNSNPNIKENLRFVLREEKTFDSFCKEVTIK